MVVLEEENNDNYFEGGKRRTFRAEETKIFQDNRVHIREGYYMSPEKEDKLAAI